MFPARQILIMNVQHPANYSRYDCPFSCTQGSLMQPPRHHPQLKTVLLPLIYLLLHHGIHCAHVPLRILEFLNPAMVALFVYLSNHLSVRFLNFLQTKLISANDKRGCQSGACLDLVVNALSVQVHQNSSLGFSNARLVPFRDATHKFFAGIAVHGYAVICVAGVARRVWFEGPSPDLGVEGFSCT